MSVVVATGPFCSKENALYEPLQALLDHCRQRPPDVLVLLGPFVDANHPQVQDGTLAQTFEDTFRSQVTLNKHSVTVIHASWICVPKAHCQQPTIAEAVNTYHHMPGRIVLFLHIRCIANAAYTSYL